MYCFLCKNLRQLLFKRHWIASIYLWHFISLPIFDFLLQIYPSDHIVLRRISCKNLSSRVIYFSYTNPLFYMLGEVLYFFTRRLFDNVSWKILTGVFHFGDFIIIATLLSAEECWNLGEMLSLNSREKCSSINSKLKAGYDLRNQDLCSIVTSY